MPFLYGNHVLKAHLGRMTEDIPEHQGVVVYGMNDIPLVSYMVFGSSLFPSQMFPRVGIRGYLTVNSGYTKIGPDSYCRFSSSVRSSRLSLVSLLRFFTSFRDVGEYLRDEVPFTSLPVDQFIILF